MKSMQDLYQAASAQGFGVVTKRSSITHDFVAEVMEHRPTGTVIDGVPGYTSFGRGAMHGKTPLIAEVNALFMVGVQFPWHEIGVDLLHDLDRVLVDQRVIAGLEDALAALVEAMRG